MMAFGGLIFATVISGALPTALRHPITLSMLPFLGWLCVTTVTSTWRYQSWNYLTSILYALVVYFAILAFSRTPRSLDRTLKALGWIGILHGFFALYAAKPGAPRLVYVSGGFFGDPNQLGLYLVAGLPFCWYLMKESGYAVKIIVGLAQFGIFWAFLKTSSRGALLALAICVLIILWFASPMRKALVVASCVLGVVGFLAFAPPYVKLRFTNIFSSNQLDENLISQLDQSSVENLGLSSGEARMAVLTDSLIILRQNPILGVGLGNFGNSRWSYYKEKTGRNFAAATNHNTYLQIATETGVPGLLFFLFMLAIGFRNALRAIRFRPNDGYQVPERLRNAAFYILLAQFTSMIGTFFLSQGYFEIIILLGLMVAVQMAVQFDYINYRRRVAASLP